MFPPLPERTGLRHQSLLPDECFHGTLSTLAVVGYCCHLWWGQQATRCQFNLQSPTGVTVKNLKKLNMTTQGCLLVSGTSCARPLGENCFKFEFPLSWTLPCTSVPSVASIHKHPCDCPSGLVSGTSSSTHAGHSANSPA